MPLAKTEPCECCGFPTVKEENALPPHVCSTCIKVYTGEWEPAGTYAVPRVEVIRRVNKLAKRAGWA